MSFWKKWQLCQKKHGQMDDGGDTDYEEDEQLDGGEHDNDTNSTNATKEATNG